MDCLNTIEEAIKAVSDGRIIVVVDSEDRENEGDLVCSAHHITPEKVNFMAKEGRGLICAPISRPIAERLGLPPMVANNNECTKCNFTVSIDAKEEVTTGISAQDRAHTLSLLARESTMATDIVKPGHVFPIRGKNGGVLVRAGHTEACLDLLEMAGLPKAGVICEVANDDGSMAKFNDLIAFKKKHNMVMISISDLIAYRRKHEQLVSHTAEASLPTVYGEFNIHVYQDKLTKKEHVLLSMEISKQKIPYWFGFILNV